MEKLSDLRGEGVGGTGRDYPENIYAYMHSPWTQDNNVVKARWGNRGFMEGEKG